MGVAGRGYVSEEGQRQTQQPLVLLPLGSNDDPSQGRRLPSTGHSALSSPPTCSSWTTSGCTASLLSSPPTSTS